MATTISDPRHYLSIQPMKTATNHVGLKITSRSLKPNYTCEYPQHKQLAKENFYRRKYQISQCGYRSSICAPYKELGNVVLDSKQLILQTLGQEEKKEPEKTSNYSDDDDNVNPAVQNNEDEASVRLVENHTKNLRTMEKHLNRSVKVMRNVKLGRSLFDLVDKEKHEMEKQLCLKRSKELKEKRERVLSVNNSDGYEDADTDSDGDFDISKYIVPSVTIATVATPNIVSQDRGFSSAITGDDSLSNNINTSIGDYLANLSTTIEDSAYSPKRSTTTTNVNNNFFQKKKKIKKKYLPRTFSPVFTNLNFYRVASSDGLFRQLCAVNWILEAMSQDNNPPIMSSICTCWNLRELKDAPKLLQKRIEKEKIVEPIWQSFLSNPSKFQYKGQRRTHAPRLSFKNGGSSCNRGAPQLVNQNKTVDHLSETNFTTNCDDQSSFTDTSRSPHHVQKENELSKSNADHSSNDRQSGSVGGEEDQLKINKCTHWNKIRASYKFDCGLADVVAMKMKKENNKTSDELEQVPARMRGGFSAVRNEQAIILHDNLEAIEKTRWTNYEKKFLSVAVMNNMYKTLKTFREQEKENERTQDDNDEEERNTPVHSTCFWYTEMTQTLPTDLKEDRNIALILKKLKRFCDLEGRKISCSHFVRALSILRSFELCYPDISAAIEFVRDKIVKMDKKELEDWCKRHIKRSLRSQSAPPVIELCAKNNV